MISNQEIPAESIALADIDLDGDIDVLLGSDAGNISRLSLFWGDTGPQGQRIFTDPGTRSSPGKADNWGFHFIAVTDLLSSFEGPEIVGQGGALGLEGKFWPIDVWDAPAYQPSQFSPRKFALGDLDANGGIELVVSSDQPYGEIAISENTNSFPKVFKRSDEAVHLGTETEDLLTTAIVLTDIDHDAKPDIAVAGYWSEEQTNYPQVQLFRNKCEGTGIAPDDFETAELIDMPGLSSSIGKPLHIAAGELGGDSYVDFVLAGEGGSLVLLMSRSLFVRGDVNADGRINIADPISLLGFLFGGSEAPSCTDTADANDDGKIDIADPIRILGYLFGGQGELPPPNTCGKDPSLDDLDCKSYEHCP